MSGDDEGVIAIDEVTNGLKGGFALEARRTGDGVVSSMDLGAPLGAESVGDLAENDGGSDLALEDFLGQMSGGDGEQGVETVRCLAGISDQRRVFELCSSLADPDCPTEMVANFRGEEGGARLRFPRQETYRLRVSIIQRAGDIRRNDFVASWWCADASLRGDREGSIRLGRPRGGWAPRPRLSRGAGPAASPPPSATMLRNPSLRPFRCGAMPIFP